MRLQISSSIRAAILRDAAASPTAEICGLLFGSPELVAAHRPCDNVSPTPGDRFEIDPAALLSAHRRARTGGPAIIGCYHSHPSGAARPSSRDAAAADPNGWVWLIAGADGLAAFRAGIDGTIHGRFDPVELCTAADA